MAHDEIIINDLLVRAILGVNPDERIERQDVVINISLFADTRRAGQTDDLRYTVNYRTIAKQVIELAECSRFLLVEKLAAEIAKMCLQVGAVKRVRVRVEKPTAARFAKSVGVVIERGPKDFQDE